MELSHSAIDLTPPSNRAGLRWLPPRVPGWVLCFAAMVLGSLVLPLLASEAPRDVFPSTKIVLLWGIPLWLTSRLRNPYSRALVWIWAIWFAVGSCNLVASYLAYGDFYFVKADPAVILYEAGVTVLVMGLLAAESLMRRRLGQRRGPGSDGRTHSAKCDLPSLFFLFLLVFPFGYLASMLTTVGYIPMFQGRSFAADIYETDYGPLYGYGTVLVFSLLAVLHRVVSAQRQAARLWWLLLLLVFLFIALADGKRYFAIIALLAAYPLYSLSVGHGHRSRVIAGTILVVASGGLIYLGVLLVRSGYQLPISSILPYALAAIGVEYRDLAYSLAHFTPGHIAGYDWLRSTFFSLVNSQVLAAVGIDKTAETLKGSAYVWRDLFGAGVGIRTGLLSELYFAYSVWAAPILLVLGMMIGVVTERLARKDRGPTVAFWAVLYAIAVLTIVGQSTSTAGLVSLVGYTYCVYWVAGRVAVRVAPQSSVQRTGAAPDGGG